MALEILVVDDERDIRELVAGVLSDEGYECRTAGDSTSALAMIDHMGMPLDGGQVEGGTLRCPYHGFVYRLETGECLTVPEVQLAMHAVKVAGERVAVRLRR